MDKKKTMLAIAALLTSGAMAGETFAYGAIAVDDQRGDRSPGYGFATGKRTEEAAKRAAMQQCREAGNHNCKIAVWFKQCGAYASSNRYYGYGYGDSKHVAMKNALDGCGRSACRVVVAKCE
jgi:hypothetical protein